MLTKPPPKCFALNADYFRIRDFEYAQPLYDLAFLLEVQALSAGHDVPKYRTFSLWRAAYRMDGYTTSIDQWIDGKLSNRCLDNVPSARIRQYLEWIRVTGTLPEIAAIEPEKARRILRLRSVRGLGAARIAELIRSKAPRPSGATLAPSQQEAVDLEAENGSFAMDDGSSDLWQAAHVVPPLLRFLRQVQFQIGFECAWGLQGLGDGLQPVEAPFFVRFSGSGASLTLNSEATNIILANQPFFIRLTSEPGRSLFQHQLGWAFWLESVAEIPRKAMRISELAKRFDPFTRRKSPLVRGDLHLHTSWSDGTTDIAGMAAALKKSGREYFGFFGGMSG